MTRSLFTLIFLLLFVVPRPLGVAHAAKPKKTPKLYWLIPDGLRADPRDFDIFRFAKEGRYPNIKRMMERGSYGYSIPTYPSHTPTNFATLLTGVYPERHGVADGPMHVEGYPLDRPSVMGFASTAKKVPPIWRLFEERGLKVAVVSMPGSTPPELDAGITIRGRWGKWGSDFFALNFETLMDPSQRTARGRGVRLFFIGPELTRFPKPVPAAGWQDAPESFSPPLEIEMEGYGASVFAYIYDESDDGNTNYSAVLLSRDRKTPLAILRRENEWTEWKPVSLRWQGLDVATKMKLALIKLEPNGFAKIRIYYDLLNRTTIKPSDLAQDIREKVGPMVDFVDNWPAQLNRHIEDKATFLTEAHMALDWHKRLVSYLYDMPEPPQVVIHDTYVPNQMLESRWWLRYLDRDSEDYGQVDEAARQRLWDEVHSVYRKIDDMLGLAMAKAGPDALIVLSSDHGVIPVKRYMLINNLLAKEGLLEFSIDLKTGEPKVNWEKTKAIHLKMHGIYIHPDGLAGNWKRGRGREYRRLRKRVAKLLRGLSHDGVRPIKRVLNWEEAGKLRLPKDRVADLIIEVRPGYGLNEEMTADGELYKKPIQSGYKQALVADEVPGLWTPFIVMGPGVRKGRMLEHPIRHVDQAPTLLTLMGIPVPKRMQGKVIDEVLEH